MSNKPLFWEVLQPEYLKLFDSHKFSIEYSNENRRFAIKFLPSNEPVNLKENKRIIEVLKIANHLCMLPLKTTLKDLIYSRDLEELFERQRAMYEHIAKHFVISSFKIDMPALSSQKIRTMNMTWYDYELMILDAELCCTLWSLIRASFLYIREGITDLPFETDLELYCEILSQHAADAFVKRTSEHFIVDTNEMSYLLEGMSRQSLEPDEAEKIWTNPLVVQESWLHEIYPILVAASQEDDRIAMLLAKFDEAWQEEADFRITALSVRHGKGKVLKSHEWKNGRKELLRRGRPPRKK